MEGIDRLYAEPKTRAADVDRTDEGARLRKRSALLLLASLVGMGASVALGFALPNAKLLFFPLAGTSLAALAGGVYGLASAWKGGSALAVLGSLALAITNLAMAGVGAIAALLSTVTFTRGRQIRSLGRPVLPPIAEGDAWTALDVARIAIDEHDRAAVADQWRENGRTEHASVAAFARLTLDLVALGAPPSLVAAASRDALDEIRHAELCFTLARAVDGRALSPAAFPEAKGSLSRGRPRTMALAALAVDSLVDGALNEGVSARVVARVAKRCVDPEIRAVLRGIAADEGRHSAHGWDVVRWCLAEGGAPVAHALAAAVRALPEEMRSPLDAASRGGAWERWGIPGAALESDELAKTRADVVKRVAKLVAPWDLRLAA